MKFTCKECDDDAGKELNPGQLRQHLMAAHEISVPPGRAVNDYSVERAS